MALDLNSLNAICESKYIPALENSLSICFTNTDWEAVYNKLGESIPADIILPLNYANSSSLKEEVEEWLAL